MEQLDPVQVVGAAHRPGDVHVNHRSCGGVGLVNRQGAVPGQFGIQLFQLFKEEGSKALPILADHHLPAGLPPLLGDFEGVLAVVRLVLQSKVVISLESATQGFQEYSALQVQELVLTLGKTVKGLCAGLNLQLAVFKPTGHFHVAETDLAGNPHIAFFKGREFHPVERPALIPHHVVDTDGGALVVFLGNLARLQEQGIQPLVLALQRLLQFFKFRLPLVEYRRVLHKDRGRLCVVLRLGKRF